jgi:hypothetical protein
MRVSGLLDGSMIFYVIERPRDNWNFMLFLSSLHFSNLSITNKYVNKDTSPMGHITIRTIF